MKWSRRRSEPARLWSRSLGRRPGVATAVTSRILMATFGRWHIIRTSGWALWIQAHSKQYQPVAQPPHAFAPPVPETAARAPGARKSSGRHDTPARRVQFPVSRFRRATGQKRPGGPLGATAVRSARGPRGARTAPWIPWSRRSRRRGAGRIRSDKTRSAPLPAVT
jgi:hypothetical protein